MIVFTATNKVTNEVYVGSAKDGMEEQWARLIVQAEEGGAGEFLSAVRESGADSFVIEMYAYADSPAESRELVRDACDELNAKLIRTGRAPAPSVEAANNQASKDSSPAETPAVKPVNRVSAAVSNITSINASKTKKTEASTSPTTSKTAERQAQREHGPVQSIDVSAYLASQQEIAEKQEKKEVKAEVVSLRQKDSTKDFDDMKEVMMRIEMKRRQNRQGASSKTKTGSTSKSSKAKKTSDSDLKQVTGAKRPSKSTVSKDKLPDGRVSSAAKEKRIKEAIAQEKMEREAAQAAKAAAEAKEMAAIMAKLDQRSKETERIRRRR
jgi:colicin import membrane protein